MPPKKSKDQSTTPRRRSPRKKASNAPKSTQTEVIEPQKERKMPTRPLTSSSEPDVIETVETGDSEGEMEVVDISGVGEDEIDELVDSEGDEIHEIHEIDEIDELDELESSALFGKSSPKAAMQQSDGEGDAIVHLLVIYGLLTTVLDFTEDELPKPTDDSEVDEFFDDALCATKSKPAEGSNRVPRSLKLKVKPQHASSQPTTTTGSGRTHKKKASKIAPNITHEVDVSDLIVPSIIKSRVQLPDGTKSLRFDQNASFLTLKFQAAEVFEVPAKHLRLAYTTNETKRERRLLVDEDDFTNMTNDIVEFFERQIKTIHSQRLKDAAAAHNAEEKGRAYVPKAQQEITDIGLIFYHQPPADNPSTSSKGTSTGNAKSKDPSRKEPKPESLSMRIQHACDEIMRATPVNGNEAG
ncbi:hypothetical protein RhiTH_011493 [Rhizoctonia solani]